MGVFSRILTSLLIGIAVAIGFIILIAVIFEFIVVLVPSDVKEGLGF